MNVEELKFKCGLEIHQQLDGSKLFCGCPSVLRKDEPEFSVKRKLHATAGESGEIDVAALYQSSLKKEFTYQGYDTTCLVELDEEPPHEINEDALETTLHVALLLNCRIVPITQIMRKTVIDGSNTSGFQRTVLVAENGHIEVKRGRVGIKCVYLEEDAARIMKREKSKETYRLDRLGTPVVEIVTESEVKDPEHAKEVALKIGEILRSCRVKRGIGTIRQDVNVSIMEGNRTEMKGMQDMNVFTKAIENEIARQEKLLKSGSPVDCEVRNVLKNGESEFMRPLPGRARMYPETDLPILKISRNFINGAKKSLPKSAERLEKELGKKGLDRETIKLLFKRKKLNEFGKLSEISEKPVTIARMLLIFPKEIARRRKKTPEEIEKKLNENVLASVLEFLEEGKIRENQVKEVLEKIADGKALEEAAETEEIDAAETEEKIMKMMKEKPGLSEKAYMGLAMKELGLKGKISGKEIIEVVRRHA